MTTLRGDSQLRHALRGQWSYALVLVPLIVVATLLWIRVFEPPEEFVPRTLSELQGTELLIVFIGASDCAAASAPWFPETFRSLGESLATQANQAGMRPVRIGVALDSDRKAGLAFLDRMGEFDEISVGRSWLNQASLRYLIRDIPADAAVPQVVVLAHSIATEDSWMIVSPEVLLERKIGLQEIQDWEQTDFHANLSRVEADLLD